jgi:hypothetical protein
MAVVFVQVIETVATFLGKQCTFQRNEVQTIVGVDCGHHAIWSARLEMCQWIRETLDKESDGTRKEVPA